MSDRQTHQAVAGTRPVWLAMMASLVGIVLVCWVGGFLWFLHIVARPVEPLPAHADGIVALTGGAGRVELALHLLATGHADKLLVSGIGGNADLPALGHLAHFDVSGLTPRITLGRYAGSTQGNAVETAAWAVQNRIHSIIVVTAAFHMPRARAELHQALPDARLLPLPVEQAAALSEGAGPALTDDVPTGDGPTGQIPNSSIPAGQIPTGRAPSPGLRLQAVEYTKYLLVIAGLSSWLPHREAFAAPAGSGPVQE